ncbi:MAG: CPBP family intramembrane metalloprotease [Hellea sp.]|nr:CPBP family intramembrane metalloprotease [Hellea sp.]
MFENGHLYFNQSTKGESRWWSWGMGSWLMVIGFFIGQIVLAILLMLSLLGDAELFNRFLESLSSVETEGFTESLIAAIFAFCAIASIPAFLLFRGSQKPNLWGYISLVLVLIGAIAAGYLLSAPQPPEMTAMIQIIMGSSAVNYAIILSAFIFPLIALLIATRLAHRRYARTLITAAERVNWKRMVVGAFITFGVLGLLTAVLHFTGLSKVSYHFDAKRFAGFTIASLLFIPFQSAAEELVFRGYLNQAFSAFFKNKWIIFAITSALFASMHLSNPESQAGAEVGMLHHILIMSGYFLFGFVLCVIVYFEGGLEAVIGVHAANNLFAAIFVNYEGSVLPTPSIFMAKAPETSDNFTLILMLGIIAYLLYRTRTKLAPLDDEQIILKRGGPHP